MAKGLDIYSIIGSGINQINLQYSIPDQAQDNFNDELTNGPLPNCTYFHKNVQIDANWFQSEEFKWNISIYDWPQPATRDAYIDPNGLRPVQGSLSNMMDTNTIEIQSSNVGNYMVCYGFYDAGMGIGDMTNQDQSYLYITQTFQKWMGGLNANDIPFNQFVLPGAHDAGMYDTTNISKLVAAGGAVITYFLNFIGLPLSYLSNQLIINLSITQKENIFAMLDLGIRYFDFRPGKMYADTYNLFSIYHQHNVIPGTSFPNFLEQIFYWLGNQPTEIVVIGLCFNGFANDSMKPASDELKQMIDNCPYNQSPYPKINYGGREMLDKTYGELIASNTRVIFLNSDEVGFCPANKYDSYSDKAYQTTDVNSIINALEKMNSGGQAGKDYTVLKLQGTASAASGGVKSSIGFGQASSPLMSTKAKFDSVTYPWLIENVPKNLSNNQLLICLNDFCETALTDVCVNLTKERMKSN